MFFNKYNLLFSISLLNAQENTNEVSTDVEIGDVFKIGQPETNSFEHIDFPSTDFIVQSGGNANLRSVVGKEVMVTSLKKKNNGVTQIKVTSKDGSRFFDIQKQVTINLDEAIQSGELLAK